MGEKLPIDRLRSALRRWSDAFDADTLRIEAIPPGVTADVFLLTAGDRRWVAKFAYDHRDYFETGLRAAAAIDGRVGDYMVAAPVLTDDGAYTVMVEWPEAKEHPLCVLRFVEGEEVHGDDPRAVEILGGACGRVHRSLLDVDAAVVGVQPACDAVPRIGDNWDLGELAWLTDVYRDLSAQAASTLPALRTSVGVWDGPDIRVHGDRIGLLDFGHTSWFPLVHVVANRCLIAAMDDEDRIDRFLRALEQHLPLTAAERDALDLYRLVNALIYARWATAHPSPNIDRWRDGLVAVIRVGAPAVGVRLP